MQKTEKMQAFDPVLIWIIFILIAIGTIMVSSATNESEAHSPFIFAKTETFHILLGLFLMLVVLSLSTNFWNNFSSFFLVFAIILLFFVLFFSRPVNGASRWISFGFLNFQPAELTKLAFFCYLSSYLSRKIEEVQQSFWGFFKPMLILLVISVLLLKQPDLGTVIILFSVTLGILFISGAKLWQFIMLIFCAILSFVLLILFEPYRLKRITGFLDPWENQDDSGYQLTNSLMAIGNGGFFGKGLGNSISKLGYLPEAHTDFIVAILAEELGYLGCLCVFICIAILVTKCFLIGLKSLSLQNAFSGYFACQMGLWIAFQSLINLGVVSGLLPTKGLTLPFISYGGSSLLIMLISVGFLLRIDYENRQKSISN